MDNLEKLIEFIYACNYLTEEQKRNIESDFKNNRECISIFEDMEKKGAEKELEIKELQEEIKRLEVDLEESNNELEEFEYLREIKESMENLLEIKIKKKVAEIIKLI